MPRGNVLKQKEKKKNKSEKKSNKKKMSYSSFRQRLEKRKTKSITGSVFLLLSIYLFIAFTSYLVSWKSDQNLILSNSLYEFLFTNPEIEVKNWLGKLGAWVSHLFMYNWFGIISYTFSFLFFIVGVRLLLNIRLVPLKKTFLVSIVGILWFSAFFGLISPHINYLGGAFGFASHLWLTSILGGFGAFMFLFTLLFVAIVLLFNPDFKAIYAQYLAPLLQRKKETNQENQGTTETENAVHSPSNTFTDSEEELEEDVVEFEEEFEKEIVVEPEKTEEEEDFEVVSVSDNKKEEEATEDSSEDFSVEIAKKEKELDDKEVSNILEASGPYDPKLELSKYILPPPSLLRKFESDESGVSKAELEENKNKIVQTLANYKIEISKIRATIGPTVTLYEIIPAPGVRISKIKNLEDDIALSLSALGIRIIAPIPGKGTVGIEVPNSSPEMVSMHSLIVSEKFQKSKYELPVVLGKTITNETFAFDLAKMPHLLVAGATGQGKSVGLNAILVSLLYKKHPAEVKFVLVDPKKVELTLYNKIERHFLAKLPGEEEAIITDTSKVVNTLNSLTIEMDNRYELLKEAQVRNIKEYNAKFIARNLNPEKGHRYMPYIVVLIDEFADLIMTAGKDVEHPIARLAQLARAIGIHLIVATQRPSVNVITGMIKANFPARIAFRVLSKIDSRTILDSSGADQLIGKGDMLISTGSDMVRLQCGFVDTPEVEEICDFIGNQKGYSDAMLLPEFSGDNNENSTIDIDDDLDVLFVDAAQLIVLHQQGSTSLIQRKMKLGYNRAGRIMDQLEAHGIVGPSQGSKAREVLMTTSEELMQYLAAKGIR